MIKMGNEIKNWQTKKLNRVRSWFFKMIGKIDNHLAIVIKIKTHTYTHTNPQKLIVRIKQWTWLQIVQNLKAEWGDIINNFMPINLTTWMKKMNFFKDTTY